MNFYRTAAVAACLASVCAHPSVAQAQEATRIREIVVQGVQRIEAETVRSYISLAEGDAFDTEKMDKSLKSLFATGLFADVSLRREGDALVVRVVENPIINRIQFEGNRRVKDEQLTPEVQLRARQVYTRTKVQTDVKRLLDIYRRQGRFAATVEPKIIQLDQNRVDLVFEINEGPSTYVSKINFVGAHHFSDKKLRETLQTKEERWYRFFSQDDTYDPDRLAYDRELLRRHYLKNGYADFRVASAVAELTPDRASFFITFTIEEGERYKFGKVDVQSTLKDLDVDVLKEQVKTTEGDWFNADDVEATIRGLTDAVGNKGYAFVDVRPREERKREERVINIGYDIQEGPRVFVERIDIQGNARTLDKVIRREFTLVEGDAFNTAKLRRSKQRIRDLNFFEKVEVTNVPSESAPDRTVIKVDVEERSTGELSFGVGYSTQAGAVAEVSVRERNLLGRGQDVRVSATLGQRKTSLDMSFTEPYFLDRRMAAGVDLFSTTNKLQTESSFDSTTVGGALRLGYYFNDALRQDWKYTLKQTKVENVADSASLYIKQQEGTQVLSSVSEGLLYDRRDSKIDPTTGYFVRWSEELAGFGGTQRFVRSNVSGAHYWPVADQTTVSVSGTGGHVVGLGREVGITERFNLGGDTLRGFRSAGVSPRDASTNDALGGLWMYTASTQLDFPIGLPQELGVTGIVFSDFGAIGRTVTSAVDVNQSSSLRASVGTGMTWRSPMGPITVDLGFPVMRQTFDTTEVFRINFGTRF